MSNEMPMKKQSFLGCAAVLALATAVVKLIGMFFKIPLQMVIHEAGYGYFTTAYDIYSVLLMISTTGLPVAMSRMISEAQALGEYAQIKRIYKVSFSVFLVLGLVGFAGMAIFCKQLASLLGQRDAWYAVLALSPAVLFIGMISSYRGFFQGQSNMLPTSISQIMEALCKLFIGLTAAWIIMKKWNNVPLAAGGAILGVTVGTVIATLYLSRKHRQAERQLAAAGGHCKSKKATLRQLLYIAIPITIGSAGLQLINLLDAIIYMYRLKGAAGFTQAEADVLKGIYNYCQTIFNLPCAFITSITISVIPAVTSHLAMKNNRGVRMVEDSAIRVMALIALPCAMGLACLSGPVYQLLSSYTATSLLTARPVLAILGVAVIFNSLVLVTNAIMQAHGDVMTPVINMLLGGVVKIIVNFILVGNPAINIVGAAIGTLCCYIAITLLNLIALRRKLHSKLSVPRLLAKPLLASLIMGAVAILAYKLVSAVIPSQRIDCLLAIAVAGVAYLVLVVVLKIITADDCALLPKGEKIARILRIR